MKHLHAFTAAAFAAVLLSGCISAPAGGAHVGYYDGYYGAYHGGFWGSDGAFYYFTDAAHVSVRRDGEGHFRMYAANGYYPVEARQRVRRLERMARQTEQASRHDASRASQQN